MSIDGDEVAPASVSAMNLADPDFEPTDQQLIELSRHAFAGLPEKRRAIDARVREGIRLARESLR